MKIFPAIDIKDKKCVRLIKGDFDNKTEYDMSPVEQAGKYKDHGFKNLHIVDLDGALTGETVNIDIIEEIARIYGYDRIPSNNFFSGSYIFEHPDPESDLEVIKNTFVGCGFHQIYSNSLQSKKETYLVGDLPIKMLNPLNVEMSYLRTSLLPGLIKAVDYNKKHSINDFRLFELGNIHSLKSKGNDLENIVEKKYLSGITSGYSVVQNVHAKSQKENLFNLKGYLELLFVKKLGMNFELIEKDNQLFEYSWSIAINRIHVGTMGRISDTCLEELHCDLGEIFAFEIDLVPIKKMFRKKKYFQKIIPYPKISRDLNLVMPVNQKVGQIVEIFFKKGKKIIVDAIPVDIFIDNNLVGEGLKSVTFSIVFQSSSKTLEDKDVNSIIDEIIHVADKNFNAKLRA